VKLLLDTQAFLWFVTDDGRQTTTARTAIEDPGNELALRIASVWEMAIKHSLGELQFTEPFEQFTLTQTAANSADLLPISLEHAMAVAFLPQHHRDPFDRLLIVQAQGEKMAMVSSDEQFDRYGISRIW
jgi:PIN domain nuclease of toxin-antitoxin system